MKKCKCGNELCFKLIPSYTFDGNFGEKWLVKEHYMLFCASCGKETDINESDIMWLVSDLITLKNKQEDK